MACPFGQPEQAAGKVVLRARCVVRSAYRGAYSRKLDFEFSFQVFPAGEKISLGVGANMGVWRMMDASKSVNRFLIWFFA